MVMLPSLTCVIIMISAARKIVQGLPVYSSRYNVARGIYCGRSFIQLKSSTSSLLSYYYRCRSGTTLVKSSNYGEIISIAAEEVTAASNPIFTSKIPYSDICKNEVLLSALASMNITVATDIQQKTHKIIGEQGLDAIIGAETGSGKTLAYLVPLLERYTVAPPEPDVVQQTSDQDDEWDSLKSSPEVKVKVFRGIIFAPTSELCDQIMAMSEKLVAAINSISRKQVVFGKSLETLYTKKSF